MAERVPARLSPSQARKFALTVGGAFMLLAGLATWRGHAAVGAVAGTVGVLLAATGVLAPSRLGPIYRAWMRLALAISKVTTPVIMGVMYLFVFTPFGVVMRTFGRNPLKRRLQGNSNSFWIERSTGDAGRGRMNNQF